MLEHLHTIVAKIDDNNESFGRDANATGSIKFTRTRAFGTKFCNEHSGGSEDLDSIVTRIGDNDIAFFINDDTVWTGKVSIFRSLKKLREINLEIKNTYVK